MALKKSKDKAPKVSPQENKKDSAAIDAALRAIKTLPFRNMLSSLGRAVPADRGPAKETVCPKL